MLNIKDALDYINSINAPAQKEAADLFPKHPKAQEVWVKLCTMNGGIEESVEVLGLHDEFKDYMRDWDLAVDRGNNETASMQTEGFVNFCKERVREEFYMFK